MRAESWKVLEENYRSKKLRSIGVSNYTLEHMKELVSFCESQGVHVQAYSSLGQNGASGPLFNSEVVKKVCNIVDHSPAQVLLRWGLQKGFTVMPKSVHPERIKENINLDFEIPPACMDMLDNLEQEVVEKYAWDPSTVL